MLCEMRLRRTRIWRRARRLGQRYSSCSGAIVAMIDRDDSHHHRLRAAFEAGPDEWVLPWAILPEVDYIYTPDLLVPQGLHGIHA